MILPDDCQAISVSFTSVKKCKAIITELIENTVLRSLVIIGKRQDQCKLFFVQILKRFLANIMFLVSGLGLRLVYFIKNFNYKYMSTDI